MRHTVLLAFALFVSLGCSDSTGPSDGPGDGDFTITVGSGLNPTYSWTGTTASGVFVWRFSKSTGVWGFTTFGGSTIESPVHHGTVPTGGIPLQTADLEPTLTAGVRYRVTVYLTDSSSAQIDFTR